VPDGERAPLARCERLVVGRGRTGLLPPIDLAIDPGTLTLVVGRNGAGKSTFARTLLGLLPPVSGRVALRRPDLRLTYVPQRASLDDALPIRARELVAFGQLRGYGFLRPWAARSERDACDAALTAASASDLAQLPLRDLSEGQKQRVLFARLIASDAELALLDEPTAAMDPAAQRAAFEQLTKLAKERGMGLVVISHALGVALEHATHVLFLDRDHGVVVYGEKEEALLHPELRRHYGSAEQGAESAHG